MLPSVSQNTTMSQLLAVVTTTATTATTMSNGPIVNDHLNSSSALNDNVTLEQQLSATNSTNPLTMTDTIMPKMDNMMDVFKISCSTAMIIGGLLPFLPQYIKIKKSRSSDGFSTYVCLTLLLANILRIAFWFGHRFELPLLIQSFVMIAGMMAMMDICIRVRNMESGYVVSSIGVRPNTMRTRRSLIVHDNDHGNGLDNETTHIYSVTTPRSPSPGDYNSDIAQCTAAPPAESVGATQISSELKPYHEQDPNREEDPSSVSNRNKMAHATTSRYQLDGDEDIISSFPDNESPILNKILAGNSTSQEAMPNDSYIANVPQDIISPCNGNGQLANNEEAALVKCLNNHYFWDWDDHFSYVKFLVYFIAVIESLLGVPQLLRNYRKKSTRGMSVEMVVMWLSGDIFKTLYFILRQSPAQFIACGSIQVSIDILIIAQVLWYRRQVTYCRLPKTT